MPITWKVQSLPVNIPILITKNKNIYNQDYLTFFYLKIYDNKQCWCSPDRMTAIKYFQNKNFLPNFTVELM